MRHAGKGGLTECAGSANETLSVLERWQTSSLDGAVGDRECGFPRKRPVTVQYTMPRVPYCTLVTTFLSSSRGSPSRVQNHAVLHVPCRRLFLECLGRMRKGTVGAPV